MTDFKAWIPPAGAVVDPPVHPETKVRIMWSDGIMDDERGRLAGSQNWSSVGDGPSVVAYAVIEEYKPAPKVAREWWLIDECEAWDSLREAKEAIRNLRPRRDGGPIIHVREVLEGREVVAWAAVKGAMVTPCNCESSAETVAKLIGGTVVKLTGVMPNE